MLFWNLQISNLKLESAFSFRLAIFQSKEIDQCDQHHFMDQRWSHYHRHNGTNTYDGRIQWA